MAYTKHTWTISEPITQEKMNNIENGIANAHAMSSDISALDARLDKVDGGSALTSADLDSAGNLKELVKTIKNTANTALSTATTADSKADVGNRAWTYVAGAMTIDPNNDTVTVNLADRFRTDEGNISSATTNINLISAEISAARGQLVHHGNSATADDLKEKLDDMDWQINTNKVAINNSLTDYNKAKGTFNSLQARLDAADTAFDQLSGEIETARDDATDLGTRLDAIDGSARPTRTLPEIITEINGAHRAGVANDTLDNRLDAIDNVGSSSNQTHLYRITQLESEISTARQSEANLDARLDGIDTNIDTINTNLGYNDLSSTETVAKKIADAVSTAQTALETRIDAIDNASTGTVHGLDSRLSAVENEIDAANGSGTLDDRFDAAEGRLDSIEANISTIAGELAMVDGTSIVDTNTRVDTLESDLRTMAAELNMLDGTAIVDTNTRVDGLENEITGAHRDGITNDTLAQRFTAVETTANAAATASDLTTLAGRVTTLENTPKSATVIIPASRIIYDNSTGAPTIYEDDYDDSQGATNTPITPSTDVDYLLGKNDGKYYYWKYIQTASNPATYSWNLISGGSTENINGGGSSSGEFAASLAAIGAPDANIDYFVGDSTNGYIHYRYVPAENPNEAGAFVQILPVGLINSVGVASINVTTADAAGEAPAVITTMSGGLQAYTVNDTSHATNLLNDFTALRYARLKTTYEEDGITLKKQELIFTDTTGTDMAPIEIQGGGAGGAAYSARLIDMTGSTSFMAPASEDAVTIISLKPIINYGNTLAEGTTITATVQYKLSTQDESQYQNASVVIPTIINGSAFNINISSLLGEANTTTDIKITISTQPDGDEGDIYTKSLTYHVTTVVMELESIGFDQAAIRSGNQFTFNYRCKGYGLSKVMTFIIDGTTTETQDIGTSHNEILSKIISLQGLSNGMHTLRAYYSVGNAQSNELNYYFIYNSDNERVAPIVALAGVNSRIHYGDDLTINYTVYTPGQEATDEVSIEVYKKDGNTEVPISSFNQVNVTNSIVIPFTIPEYPLEENQYTIYVRITGRKLGTPVLSDTKETEIIILPASFDYQLKYADPQNHNLLFMYNVAGKSNNDINKESYKYNYTPQDGNDPIDFTASFNNFNWATNGYITDKDTGENALVISGGATCDVDVPIFSRTYTYTNDQEEEITVNIEADSSKTSINQNGRTIEIDYEVISTVDANSTIIECMGSNGAGFKVTPQSCYLVSSTTPANISEDSSGFINNESSIAAAYLSTGQRTHLVFVIEPEAETESAVGGYHQCVNIYVNGEFANSQPYSKSTVFSSNATMTIGNTSSLIKLYGIRMYNRGFTDKEVLQNYMMAPSKINDKLARFDANNVLNNETGLVDYTKAMKKYNCLLLTGTMSPYKGSPSTVRYDGEDAQGNPIPVGKRESGLILTKPNNQVSEGYTVEFNLMKKSSKDHAYLSSNNVQGTSSQKYPIHNLKVYLVDAEEQVDGVDNFVINETTGEKEYTKTTKLKYKLNGSNSIGESTLCWKADYMSTDHANTYNANLANDLFSVKLPSQDPSQGGDSKVQNTVKGIRCLLFVRADENSMPVFIGDGCLNNDKGNNKTFGLEYSNKTNPELSDNGNDTLRQKWEFTNNSEGLCLFKSDHLYEMVTTGEGANQVTEMRAKGGFESTYPDEGDLEDEGLEPNYTHLQILLTWVYQRANFWDASTTDNGTTYSYNGETYHTEYAYRKAIFLNEFSRHFVLNHVLTYYIFSEFIALCDNRAKNMFLRSDDVRSEVIKLASDNTQIIIDGNEYGDDGTLWHTIVNHTTGVVNANAIDWENSVFAVWAPVLYDLDSCYGVENVGYLTIPYDADWYYNLKGLSKNEITKAQIDNPNEDQISFQFSGVASRLWLMVEEAYAANIKALAKTLYSRDDGLNYYNVYTSQIEDNLNETSPALVNQDMILKFQNPWETGFIDYSQKPPVQSTEVYKYLQRGTKSSQKDSFVYRRATLLASQYQADSFIKGSINFRTNISVPGDQLDKTSITITANQMIYPAVTYGDNKAPISSANKIAANTPYTFQATAEVGATDTIHIAGGAVLTDVGDLSKWSPYEVKVGLGMNLKRLILGKKDAGYENLKLDRLDLSNCQLLETINVENCKALEELDVSSNGLIKEVYTFASNIKKVTVPNGGVLTKLHLGSKVTSITIQNQSYLTEFKYEGEEDQNIENPYTSVNTLWVENTPNVPIVDIITKNIANLTGGIRLNNININLGNDPTFLQILATESLMRGKYINSSGELDSTQYPYITGTVTIYDLRRSLKNQLNALYPNLTINVTHDLINEFTITYKNYDGTVLYTDHRTGLEHYIDPASIDPLDLNPITGQSYLNNTLPAKPMDAQYIYKFGSYTSDVTQNYTTYIRYSGWQKQGSDAPTQSDDYVSGDTIFIAQYPTTITRQYTVRWFEEPNEESILEYTENYGVDISTYQQPEEKNALVRVKTSGNTVKVFKGWDRPVGKLTGDIDVYAQWETSTIDNSIQSVNMGELSAADIYAISQLGTDTKRRIFESETNGIKLGNDPIMIQVGHDFNYTAGVNTTNLLGSSSKFVFNGNTTDAKIYDGLHGIGEIRPLAVNDDWTLAIDYKMLLNGTIYNRSLEWVIASCYKEANSSVQGFKISLVKNTEQGNANQAVKVTWGNSITTIDYATIDSAALQGREKQFCKSYRNVLVLRHKAAEPTVLYLYYAAPDITNSNAPYGAEYGTTINSTTLTWNNSSTLNTPLIFGGNYSEDTTNIESSGNRSPAKGIIYWAKYWDKDLGEKNCNALASWPHETIPFYLNGYNNGTSPTRKIFNNTSLSFVAAQGFGDRYFYAKRSAVKAEDPVATWSNSRMYTMCNERLYKAMPVAYQSIIKHTTFDSVALNANTKVKSTSSSFNYLYLSAEKEVNTDTITSPKDLETSNEWYGPWPWLLTPTNIKNLYGFEGSSTSTLVLKTASNIKPFLYRFSGNYIKPTARIFDISTDPYRNGGTWSYNNTQISVQSGDVWINGGTAYMYFTNAEINEGIYVDIITDGGGWKKADIWNLRTYNVDSDYSSENQFERVDDTGSLKIAVGSNEDLTAGRLLCPEFSID